jgi:hypothetical protein
MHDLTAWERLRVLELSILHTAAAALRAASPI